MVKKDLLFIGTPFMNIYQDIVNEMKYQGYSVDFIAEQSHFDDPDNVRGHVYGAEDDSPQSIDFRKRNEIYWKDVLSSDAYNKTYDILFILDGQSIHPCVFETLRERNPNLYAVNYLFDTTKGVYRFDKNFKYYDKIATFDREESTKYSIDLLPIYWKPAEETVTKEYMFFGLGRYNKLRAKLFKILIDYSQREGYKSYIKLQGERITYFPLKHIIRKITGTGKEKPSWSDYYSAFYIKQPVPLNEFRRLTNSSEVIVDTNAPHQDGLTARFMWALGLGQKILTTNKSAKSYPFYSPEQIFIVENIESISNSEKFAQFVQSKFKMKEYIRVEIDKMRIDNWVRILLQH